MKRYILLILIVVLSITLFSVFSLTSCKTESAPAEEAAEEEVSEEVMDEDFEIVMVVKLEGVSWFDDMRVGVEQFGKDYGVNAYQVGADTGDPAKQVALIEDLIAKGVDAILAVPNDPKSLEPVFKKANEQGIITISHEASSMENVSYDIEAFINEEFGATMMEHMANDMGCEGKYGILVGAHTMETHMQWASGEVAWQKENCPDMELVTDPYLEDENDAQVAYEKISELLKAEPDIKGIIGNAAFSPPQAAQIIKEKGLIGKVFAGGLSLPSFASEYIKDGSLSSIHCWRPADAGYVSALIAYMILMGQDIEEGIDLGKSGYESIRIEENSFGTPVIYGDAALTITSENIDDYNF